MIDEQLASIMPINPNSNPKELFDTNDINAKTELSAEQVMIVARLKILAKRLECEYKCSFVSEFISDFLSLQISKDRKSRQEFVAAFQSRNDERAGSLLDKFNLNLGK